MQHDNKLTATKWPNIYTEVVIEPLTKTLTISPQG